MSRAKELMHKLWTRDVGREGYHKPDWNAMDAAVSQLERQVELAATASSERNHGASGLCCQLRLQEKERGDDAERSRDFTRQWYAERIARIDQLVREETCDTFQQKYFWH